MTSYKLNEKMMSDLKYYFKFRKRDIYNTFLKGYEASPFPNGKIKTHNYYRNLKRVFWAIDEFTLCEILSNRLPSKYSKKVISKRGNEFHCHPEATFKYFKDQVIKKKLYHLEKISRCYDMYELCVKSVEASGYEDISVYCNKIYARLLKDIFNRFHVNEKCIEAKDVKGMDLIIHLPKE